MSNIVEISNRIKILIKTMDEMLEDDKKNIINIDNITSEYQSIIDQVQKLNLQILFDKSVDMVRAEIKDNWKIYCDESIKLASNIFNDTELLINDMHKNLTQINIWLQYFIALNILDV